MRCLASFLRAVYQRSRVDAAPGPSDAGLEVGSRTANTRCLTQCPCGTRSGVCAPQIHVASRSVRDWTAKSMFPSGRSSSAMRRKTGCSARSARTRSAAHEARTRGARRGSGNRKGIARRSKAVGAGKRKRGAGREARSARRGARGAGRGRGTRDAALGRRARLRLPLLWRRGGERGAAGVVHAYRYIIGKFQYRYF